MLIAGLSEKYSCGELKQKMMKMTHGDAERNAFTVLEENHLMRLTIKASWLIKCENVEVYTWERVKRKF